VAPAHLSMVPHPPTPPEPATPPSPAQARVEEL
jgi:hypothetical protein